MSAVDFDECSCSCHRDHDVMHMMACCSTCPHCDRRIKYGADRHIAECKQERETLAARLDGAKGGE
jgi:hypothetical protein